MKYIVTINGKNYEVEVEKGEASVVKVSDNVVTTATETKVSSTNKVVETPKNNNQGSTTGEKLTAPMPGLILDIKISKGSSVKKGDVLFILEAMKMENEITAPIDGTILEIAATKGASVSTGDLLAVIG